MYKISVKSKFSSAHKLLEYKGECARLHGHTWVVIVRVIISKLNDIGIGYDFKDLKVTLNSIIDKFDHQYINEISPFNKINPTSENIAKFIFDSLRNKLPDDIQVFSVEIKESDNYSVIYTEE